PATRGIAIDWTAWGGIGMATRGSVPKVMELAGIDMLPSEAGVPLIRRELTVGGTRGEIVIGQRLGVLMNEFDPTGGLEVNPAEVSAEKRSPAQGPAGCGVPGCGVMIGKIASAGLYSPLTIEEVNFLAPFKFYRNEPRPVTVEAVIHPHGDGLIADCRLLGRRPLPNQT